MLTEQLFVWECQLHPLSTLSPPHGAYICSSGYHLKHHTGNVSSGRIRTAALIRLHRCYAINCMYNQRCSQNGIIFTHTQEKSWKKFSLVLLPKWGLPLKERICSRREKILSLLLKRLGADLGLTLVMLNKLRCHAHFYLSANQIQWSRLFI